MRRLKLNSKLLEVTELPQDRVHYQPPNGHKLSYPCVIYNKTNILVNHADNIIYKSKDAYDITVIERDPDSTLAYELLNGFKYIRFNTRFNKDGLYHTVMTLYF